MQVTMDVGGSEAFQAALDSGAGLIPLPDGRYIFDAPQRIKPGTARVALRGGHRIRTILSPGSPDISKGTDHGINALFVNQDNNSHFCLENLRFYSDIAYTGVGIYCKEGGGADGLGQCLFSTVAPNLWIDFGSSNAGFLYGGVQNTVWSTSTTENAKTVFRLAGRGCADNTFRGWSLVNCYDGFIDQNEDDWGSVITTVDCVHAYSHKRGRLFDLRNWKSFTINDVSIEADLVNEGSTGLFKFKDCTDGRVTNFRATTRDGVPACAVGIDIDGTTRITFTGGEITADVGLRFIGTDPVNLTFNDVTFTGCTTAAMQFLAPAGGKIVTRGCRFNDSRGTGVLSTASNGVNWYSYDDEFINAGMGGLVGARNLTLASSGEIMLFRPRIGRDKDAAAGYFIDAMGTGTVTLYDPIWVGTAPIGRTTGPQNISVIR